VIGLSPSPLGTSQLTRADDVAARASTFVGAVGTTAVCGVTALDGADAGPLPLAFAAVTVNVYVVPVVRPLTVVLVDGGVPVTVFGVCATPLMRGVTM
jgi:hypothetical protein